MFPFSLFVVLVNALRRVVTSVGANETPVLEEPGPLEEAPVLLRRRTDAARRRKRRHGRQVRCGPRARRRRAGGARPARGAVRSARVAEVSSPQRPVAMRRAQRPRRRLVPTASFERRDAGVVKVELTARCPRGWRWLLHRRRPRWESEIFGVRGAMARRVVRRATGLRGRVLRLRLRLILALVGVARARRWIRVVHFEGAHFDVLRVVLEQGAIRSDLVAGITCLSDSEVQGVLAECEALGLLRTRRFVVGEPAPWVWLTREGCEAVSGASRWFRGAPRLTLLEHRLALAKVRHLVATRHSGALWVPEWELWEGRRVRGLGVPDAALEVGGEVHAIEIELARRPAPRLQEQLKGLCERYDAVVCFCSERTLRSVERIRLECGLDRLRVVRLGAEVDPVAEGSGEASMEASVFGWGEPRAGSRRARSGGGA